MIEQIYTETRSMPAPKRTDAKFPVTTVKIDARIHSQAKKIAVLTGRNLEDILSDILREPVGKMLRKALTDASKEE